MCICERTRIPLGGQCLTQQQADAFCGTGFVYRQGCVRLVCPAGAELDVSTGKCLPKQKVDEVAGKMGVPVGQGEKLGCPPGTQLVIDGEMAACVPLDKNCAPDEAWNGTACVKVAQCPAGATWDQARGQCVAYTKGGDGEPTVDVQQWAYANYGPHGQMGKATFCNQFTPKPFSFGVSQGYSAMIEIQVTLSFPDQQVPEGTVMTTAVYQLNRKPVPQRGAYEVQKAADSLLATLKAGGGKATMVGATTTVKCAVVNGAAPLAVPATGGV